jgi:hypothetical protein
MVGRRSENEELLYPVSDVARKHSAGVDKETSSGREAYAPFSKSKEGRYSEGSLPSFDG